MYCKSLLQSKRQGLQWSLQCIINDIEKYLQHAHKFEIWYKYTQILESHFDLKKIESTKNIFMYIMYLCIFIIVIVQIVTMADSFFKTPI